MGAGGERQGGAGAEAGRGGVGIELPKLGTGSFEAEESYNRNGDENEDEEQWDADDTALLIRPAGIHDDDGADDSGGLGGGGGGGDGWPGRYCSCSPRHLMDAFLPAWLRSDHARGLAMYAVGVLMISLTSLSARLLHDEGIAAHYALMWRSGFGLCLTAGLLWFKARAYTRPLLSST